MSASDFFFFHVYRLVSSVAACVSPQCATSAFELKDSRFFYFLSGLKLDILRLRG